MYYPYTNKLHATVYQPLLARELNVLYSVRLLFRNIMVQKMTEVVEYEKRLRGMPFVPRSSYGRGMLREDGGLNKTFSRVCSVTGTWLSSS